MALRWVLGGWRFVGIWFVAGVFVKRVAPYPPAGREPPPTVADLRRLALRWVLGGWRFVGIWFVAGGFVKRVAPCPARRA